MHILRRVFTQLISSKCGNKTFLNCKSITNHLTSIYPHQMIELHIVFSYYSVNGQISKRGWKAFLKQVTGSSYLLYRSSSCPRNSKIRHDSLTSSAKCLFNQFRLGRGINSPERAFAWLLLRSRHFNEETIQ